MVSTSQCAANQTVEQKYCGANIFMSYYYPLYGVLVLVGIKIEKIFKYV